jgi:lysophospholipase L1-like esterase
VCCNAPVTALLDKVSGHAIVMPSANSAQSHSFVKKVFRRPAGLIFTFGVLVLLVAVFLAFPRQKPCNPACVVLIGDSITSRWQSLAPPKQLSGLQIINRGIPSDSTSHMLSRFDHDVVQLHPRVVVILGGINDIARIPLPAIEQNLQSMAETAEQQGIHVVLATLLPTGECHPDKPWPGLIPDRDEIISGHDKIQTLNNWLKNFANQKHYSLVDYHSALADDRGYYRKGLSADGVHPTAEGYERIEPLLREAIQSAIRSDR